MTMSPEQMRKKSEAMNEARHHEQHATMTGMKDGRDFQQRKEHSDESGAAVAEELGRAY